MSFSRSLLAPWWVNLGTLVPCQQRSAYTHIPCMFTARSRAIMDEPWVEKSTAATSPISGNAGPQRCTGPRQFLARPWVALLLEAQATTTASMVPAGRLEKKLLPEQLERCPCGRVRNSRTEEGERMEIPIKTRKNQTTLFPLRKQLLESKTDKRHESLPGAELNCTQQRNLQIN